MKKVRIRLALIVGVSFVLTFSFVLAVFNWLMLRQIRQNAGDSLEYLLREPADETPPLTFYMTSILFLDSDFSVIPYYEISEEESQKEAAIAQWCRAHPQFDRIQRAAILDRRYYLVMSETAGYSGGLEITVSYVDVSGEMALMRSINLAILAVMLLMGAGASALGYLTGTQIERGQMIQKTFFENTSHELKTPLTAIRGFAEGMLTNVITDHPLAAKVILGETEKMTALVEDILTSARLESGAVKLHLEDVRLRDVIEDCLLPLEGSIRRRNLRIELDIQGWSLSADRNQLEHALNNILTNAIKYAASQISITYTGRTLTVWNDGGSLSGEDMKHIFDRFYTGERGNTGIGLALTREIAALHGWKLSARRYNGGIGFIFRFTDR